MNDERRWFQVAALMGIGMMAATCTAENPAYQPGPDLPGECRAGSEVTETFEDFERPGKVDLWFVVSDAEAMEDYQEAMAEAMPALGTAVDETGLDVRAAVSTMDATEGPGLAPVIGGADECAENVEAVADSGNDDWIQTLQCNIRQGTDGDRRQRALDVTRDSLVENPDSLDSFRRDDARLVAVLVSEQDDCSGSDFEDDSSETIRNLCSWQSDDLREVDEWVDQMKATTTVPEGLSVAVFSGPPAEIDYEEGESVRQVCSSSLGNAYPAPRMRRVARAFGDQGMFGSICVFDFFDHFQNLADRLVARDEVTLCASEPMAHEPLEVAGIDAEGERRDIEFGPGFRFAGPTETCEEGAIRLSRRGAESVDRVEMTYCGLSE